MELFTGVLLGFHCRLVDRNETTNEHLKGRSNERNYSLRESNFCLRLYRALSLKRRGGESMVSNDLIRISLLLESLLDFESLQ